MEYHKNKVKQQHHEELTKGNKRKLYSFRHYIEQVKRSVQHWYLLYELNLCISMCEPWEKIFLNTLIVLLLTMVGYATIAYVPSHLLSIVKYLTPVSLWRNATNITDMQYNTN